MATLFSDVLKQVRAIWSRLDGAQRTTVGAVLFAAVLGLGLVAWYAGQPDYETVFRARDGREMEAAQQALLDQDIPFQVDGERLLVDRGVRGSASGALHAADLRAADLDDRLSVLGSFAMDREGRRSLTDLMDVEGLERDLRDVPGIHDARVAWKRPERSVYRRFDEAAQNAGATVTLEVARGESFERLARMAMRTVASSLGLDEKSVVAFDARTGRRVDGDPLAAGAGGTGGADLDAIVEQEEAIAAARTRKVQERLDLAYQGQVVATVHVDLDRTWMQTTEKITSPVQRRESQTRRVERGRPTSTTNADGEVTTELVGGSEETETRFVTEDLGTRKRGQLAPEIRNVAVSLLIHRELRNQAREIEQFVENVVGDSVNGPPRVASVVVDELRQPDAGGPGPAAPDGLAPGPWARIVELAPQIAEVLAVLVVLLFLRYLLRRSTPAAPPRATAPAPTPAEEPGDKAADDPLARARRDIERSIVEDPSAMSRLVESWLAEQKT